MKKLLPNSTLLLRTQRILHHQATAVERLEGRPSSVPMFRLNAGGQVRGFPEGWRVAGDLHAARRGDALCGVMPMLPQIVKQPGPKAVPMEKLSVPFQARLPFWNPCMASG